MARHVKLKSAKRRAQQTRFRRAAKKCKGKKIKAFRACMRSALKK